MDIAFLSAVPAPAWVFVGAAVTALVNFVTARLKARTDEASTITSAHANLNKSLQAGFDMMSKELARLREDRERDAREWDEKEARYQSRIRSLQDEIERMKQIVLANACPHCFNPEAL